MSFLALVWAWATRDRSKSFHLINIHIAYPLAVQISFLERMFKVPIVITEQWSAYHYSFNSQSKGLQRIRRIFHHNIPLICVSKALKKDIERFSGKEQRKVAIVDNVAESKIFAWSPDHAPVEGRFFAIAGWRFPKRPDVLIEMMGLLRDSGKNAVLRLAGNGPKMQEMKAQITDLGLEGRVILLGHLDPRQVADEMRTAHALLHCSDYETYSAVCAESLCVGTPVIASDVGGISEYMTQATGALVANNDAQSWTEVVQCSWSSTLAANRENISYYMTGRASTETVGKRYAEFLDEVLGQHIEHT